MARRAPRGCAECSRSRPSSTRPSASSFAPCASAMPAPPRDLWARTAAAIEREARHRALQPRGGPRRSALRPYALLAGALVVAIAVGTLTSSQWFPGDATATPAAPNEIAVGQRHRPLAAPDAARRRPARTSRTSASITTARLRDQPRPDQGGLSAGGRTCATTQPSEVVRTSARSSSPETVFGSGDAPLVVLGDSAERVERLLRSLGPNRTHRSPDATPSDQTRPSSPSCRRHPHRARTRAAADASRRARPSSRARRPERTAGRNGRDRDRPRGARHDRGLRPRWLGVRLHGSAVPTARTAPTSTSGRSATPRPAPSRPTTDRSSARGPATTIVGSTVVTSADGASAEPPAAFVLASDGRRRSRFRRPGSPGGRPSTRAVRTPRSTGPGRSTPTDDGSRLADRGRCASSSGGGATYGRLPTRAPVADRP